MSKKTNILTLPIERQWFDMIVSGEKKEEYREIKPYWTSRFTFKNGLRKTIFNTYVGYVIFKNGYGKNSPKIKCLVEIRIGTGIQEWGAMPGQKYYILKIIEIQEVKNVE